MTSGQEEEKEKFQQLLKGRGYLMPPNAKFLLDGKLAERPIWHSAKMGELDEHP